MVSFPVNSSHVFSSWLNMVGCTVRDALALTIGRALIGSTEQKRIRIQRIVYIFLSALLCAITYLYTTALSAPKAPTIRSETRESELNEDIKEEDKVLTETRGWTFSCSTWVAVLIQIFVASQSEAKTVRKRAGSPLARESLSGRVHQSSVMTVINENQSMLVVSSVRTADGHVWL